MPRTKSRIQKSKPEVENPTNYDSVLSKIRSVSDIEQYLKTLLVGPTGTGKTTVLSTFPKPILILDFREQGTDSISDFGDDIKILPVTDADEVEQLYWYLYEGDHPYKTVAWENVGQAQDLFVIKAKERDGKTKDAPTHRNNWGDAASSFKDRVMDYRDLPMHVIFTSHPRITSSEEEEDAGGIAPEVGPRLMPSVASTLVGAVNIIGHTFIREATKRNAEGKIERKIQYALRLGPHPFYLTKIRKPKNKGIVPEYIVNPDFNKLLQIVRGEWEAGETKSKRKPKGVSKDA